MGWTNSNNYVTLVTGLNIGSTDESEDGKNIFGSVVEVNAKSEGIRRGRPNWVGNAKSGSTGDRYYAPCPRNDKH